MIINRVIASWLSFRARKRLERQTRVTLKAYPEIARLRQQRAYYRTHHRKGARMCDRRAFEEMCKALRGGAL